MRFATHASQATHHERDVRPEHAAVHVRLVQDDVLEPAERRGPVAMVGKHGRVEHIRVCENRAGFGAYATTFLLGGIPVVHPDVRDAHGVGVVRVVVRGARGALEHRRERSELIARQRFRGEDVQRRRRRVVKHRLERGGVVAHGFSRRGSGRHHDVGARERGGDAHGLVREERARGDAHGGERGDHRGGEIRRVRSARQSRRAGREIQSRAYAFAPRAERVLALRQMRHERVHGHRRRGHATTAGAWVRFRVRFRVRVLVSGGVEAGAGDGVRGGVRVGAGRGAGADRGRGRDR